MSKNVEIFYLTKSKKVELFENYLVRHYGFSHTRSQERKAFFEWANANQINKFFITVKTK